MRLRTKSTERWLKLSSGEEVLYRPLPMSESLKIVRKHTTVEIRRGAGQVEERDFAAINRDTYKYKIRNWKGMLDEDGNELPFNDDNLALVIEHDQGFMTLVDQTAEENERQERARTEALLGN